MRSEQEHPLRASLRSSAALLLLPALATALSLRATAQDSILGETPTVAGPISSLSSGADFVVNGEHVVTNAQTVFWKHISDGAQEAITSDPAIEKTLAVGDNVLVLGNKDRHTHTVTATKVLLEPVYDKVSGFAVIQRVTGTSPQLMVEADGYRIAITPKTVLHNEPPLADSTPPAPNLWIAYSGRWGKDGLVVAERAKYSQFNLSKGIRKGLEKSQESITAPTDGTDAGQTPQDGHIVAPYLYAPKHTADIPADAAMQQRVQSIGERLIPASQKMLADDDPQKIHFRFFALDHTDLPRVIGSPDGVVTIPAELVQNLQNDDQVAAMLSQGVAQALEWLVPPAAIGNSGQAMLTAGEMPFIGPVVSIALISGGLYEMHHGTYPSHLDPFQSSRVGLSLMHDAGYDLRQAPIATQIAAYGPVKYAAKSPSAQSAYLLKMIGLEYAHRTTPAPATEHASAP